MNSKFFKLIISILFFKQINNVLPSRFSSNTETILMNDYLIYTNNDNTIKVENLKGDSIVDISTRNDKIKCKKKLICLNENEKKFALFGTETNSDTNLYYQIYKLSSVLEAGISGSFSNINIPENYMIRLISETNCILSFKNDAFYIYKLDLENNEKFPSSGSRNVDVYTGYLENSINTIECDSYDGENIFCVYSIANKIKQDKEEYSVFCFYSFEKINTKKLGSDRIILSSRDIASPSIIKIEGDEKKYLVCGIEIEKDSTIICQYYVENENGIIPDKVYTIYQKKDASLSNQNYIGKNPILLKKHNYSIYILFEYYSSSDSGAIFPYLIICPLDLSMNVPTSTLADTIGGNKDILIRNYLFILLTLDKTSNEIIVSKFDLEIECPVIESFSFNLDNQDSGINLSLLIESNREYSKSLYFSLDQKTIIEVEDSSIFKKVIGGLINNIDINNLSPDNIFIRYNKFLDISENYYIFLESRGGQYYASSNFCFLKVVNCYEGCNSCKLDEIGTEQRHLCSSCLETKNYYKYETNLNPDNYYNCYKNDDNRMAGYYLGPDNKYYKCHTSCATCSGPETCDTCKEGYFLKEDKLSNYNEVTKTYNTLNDLCYNNQFQEYYLDYSSDIKYKDQTITVSYKNCYHTCLECYGGGNEVNNKCIKCKSPYINYNYDISKCTIDYTTCKSESKKWKINDSKNIECVDSCLDNEYIIHAGENKDQCVENCQSYINPLSLEQTNSLLTYVCDSDKYCITSSFCKLKNFIIDGNTCAHYNGKCIDMDDYTPLTDEEITGDIDKITEKVNIIKYFNYNNVEFSSITNFKINLVNRYITELKKELESNAERYLAGINFITISKYKDFTLTMFPLESEEIIYINVFESNILNFANFTQFFKKLHYQIPDNHIILVCLIERKNEDIPINIANYFFYLYNEKEKKIYTEINIEDLDLNIRETIDITYPLHNFQNSKIAEKKYSKDLENFIKKSYLIDKNLKIYSKDDDFFNDICYLFKSEVKTDMTIEDRISEYFIGINLCENKCTLINIFDKEINRHPRSLCRCQVKEEIDFNDINYSFGQTNLKKKISNIKALGCAKNVFNKDNIGNNPAFWVFLLFLITLIFILLAVFWYGKKETKNMLKINKEEERKIQKHNINNEVINKNENKEVEELKKENSLESSIKNEENYDKKESQNS